MGGNAEDTAFRPMCRTHRGRKAFCVYKITKAVFGHCQGKVRLLIMIDLKFLRENPEVVKQNIKNKFQDQKLPLVDEVIALDADARKTQQEADELRASRNALSKQIGMLMGQGKKDEAEEVKAQVSANAARLTELEGKEKDLQEKITKIMMTIPNIIDCNYTKQKTSCDKKSCHKQDNGSDSTDCHGDSGIIHSLPFLLNSVVDICKSLCHLKEHKD